LLLDLVDYNQKNSKAFFERTLEVKVNNDVLKGNVECIIAKGKRSPKAPFFCLHEYKKEIDSSNDPLGHITGIESDQIENAYQKFKANYSPEKIEIIKKLKEEEYQDGFLRDIFVNVLGYSKKNSSFITSLDFTSLIRVKKKQKIVINNKQVMETLLTLLESVGFRIYIDGTKILEINTING